MSLNQEQLKIVKVLDKNKKIYSILDKDGNKRVYKGLERGDINPLETDILFNIQSDYIIKGLEVYYGDDKGLILQNYTTKITDVKDWTVFKFKKTLFSMLMSLKCLHEMKFIHMNIRPENYVSIDDESFNVVLADFGSAIKTYSVDEGIIITDLNNISPYMDYSIIKRFIGSNKSLANAKSDIFSLAVTILMIIEEDYSLLAGLNGDKNHDLLFLKSYWETFDNSKNIKLNYMMKRLQEKISGGEKFSMDEISNLKNILSEMLDLNDVKRPTIIDIASSPFFKGFDLTKPCKRVSPEGNYFIPFISSEGIKNFNDIIKFFRYEYKESDKVPLIVLFTAIDVYMTILTKINYDAEISVYNDYKDKAIRLALNCYYKDLEGGNNMELARKLGLNFGSNRYFQHKNVDAVKLAIYLKFFVKYPNTLAFYNTLDIDKTFKNMPSGYNDINISISNFFNIYQNVPLPIDIKKIEKSKDIKSSYPVDPNRLETATNLVLQKNKKIEFEILSEINNSFEISKEHSEKLNNIVNKILESSDQKEKFKTFLEKRKIHIYTSLLKFFKEHRNLKFKTFAENVKILNIEPGLKLPVERFENAPMIIIIEGEKSTYQQFDPEYNSLIFTTMEKGVKVMHHIFYEYSFDEITAKKIAILNGASDFIQHQDKNEGFIKEISILRILILILGRGYINPNEDLTEVYTSEFLKTMLRFSLIFK